MKRERACPFGTLFLVFDSPVRRECRHYGPISERTGENGLPEVIFSGDAFLCGASPIPLRGENGGKPRISLSEAGLRLPGPVFVGGFPVRRRISLRKWPGRVRIPENVSSSGFPVENRNGLLRAFGIMAESFGNERRVYIRYIETECRTDGRSVGFSRDDGPVVFLDGGRMGSPFGREADARSARRLDEILKKSFVPGSFG